MTDLSKKILLNVLENRPDQIMETFEESMNEKLLLLIERRLEKIGKNVLIESDGDGGDENDEDFDWQFDDEESDSDDVTDEEESTDENEEMTKE